MMVGEGVLYRRLKSPVQYAHVRRSSYLRGKIALMKTVKHLLFASACCALIMACGNPAPEQGKQPEDTAEAPQSPETPPLRASHDCKVTSKMLEENASVWIRSQEILVAVTADESTYDPNYGDSYRVMEVYDTRTCELLERKVLPVNVSPDFPYYVAEISYNKVHMMAAVRGFNSIYLYDAENRKWLPELKPKFATTRYGADAQSGMIKRLEVWEDYLIGYSQDYGAFVFNLGDKNQPAPVMPTSEVSASPVDYQSLFLLPVEGAYQAISPTYDANTGAFKVNALFDAPLELSVEVQRSAQNNRYLVLRTADGSNTAVAIDVSKRERINLPADVAAKPTQEVLAWVRQNRR